MKEKNRRIDCLLIVQFLILAVILLPGFVNKAQAQQFNSDNYLTMPHGTGTFVITAGQRNATLLSSFALAPKFEFFFQANLFRDYRVKNYVQHFTTTVYAKYMFWVNKEKNGGGGSLPGFWPGARLLRRHGVY